MITMHDSWRLAEQKWTRLRSIKVGASEKTVWIFALQITQAHVIFISFMADPDVPMSWCTCVYCWWRHMVIEGIGWIIQPNIADIYWYLCGSTRLHMCKRFNYCCWFRVLSSWLMPQLCGEPSVLTKWCLCHFCGFDLCMLQVHLKNGTLEFRIGCENTSAELNAWMSSIVSSAGLASCRHPAGSNHSVATV